MLPVLVVYLQFLSVVPATDPTPATENEFHNRHTSHTTATTIHCIVLTYLLTPWSRVLLEKLTGLQLVKKFPAFYGT